MLPAINIYTLRVTQKQKKDLLGIYQDYLYFERGLEMIMHIKSIDGLAGIFMDQVGWSKDMDNLPWYMNFTNKKEQDAYIRFVNGDTKDAKQYTYISLYHTDKEQDAPHHKISRYPENYSFITIDLDLPCPVERYAIAFPEEQKIKDAELIIDGEFKTTYQYSDIDDMTVAEALNNPKIQQEFRTLLCLLEVYKQNQYKIEENPNSKSMLTGIMTRIVASETISSYENKLLDLLGSCADKTQEILRTIYPGKSSKDTLIAAEKDGLIISADSISHFLNIRHLIRHQWDSLDNLSKYSSNGNSLNKKMRDDYLKSYHWIFQNSLHERIKLYHQFSQHFQPLIQFFHPEFLVREKGESNSKFAQRIKQWQKDNPNKTPLINSNYMLYENKHISLTNNIKKIAPQAIVLDDLKEDNLTKQAHREGCYFKRAAYLKTYSQIESCFALYCLATGINVKHTDMWNHLKKKLLSSEEYDRGIKYRQLRNNLSHNYLDKKLIEDMDSLLGDTFKADCYKLQKFLFERTPKLIYSEDGFYLAMQDDGTVVKIDLDNNKIIAHYDKNGNDMLKPYSTPPAQKPKKKDTPLKLNYRDKEIKDCTFKNGIIIDLKRKKIHFPDNSRFYFDAENYNVFQFSNNKKIFTDKTFSITKYLDHNKIIFVSRNETFIAAPKHKIRTDNRCRLSESCIFADDNQKLITQMKNNGTESYIIFADGTKINVSKGKFIVSHNNITLSKETSKAFINSYDTEQPPLLPPKTPHTR